MKKSDELKAQYTNAREAERYEEIADTYLRTFKLFANTGKLSEKECRKLAVAVCMRNDTFVLDRPW